MRDLLKNNKGVYVNVYLNYFIAANVLAECECVICCKNKSRTPGFQHNKEAFEILVKCEIFRTAMTLQNSALEKGDNDYLLVQIRFIEAEEKIAKELVP